MEGADKQYIKVEHLIFCHISILTTFNLGFLNDEQVNCGSNNLSFLSVALKT
jgi:hypothetical protein